jgi:hypothetical protein
VPTNIILEIRIEDRASRLFYHQKQQQIEEEGGAGDSASEHQQQQPIVPMFNIRNRAIVEILVIEGDATKRSKQKPKVKCVG